MKYYLLKIQNNSGAALFSLFFFKNIFSGTGLKVSVFKEKIYIKLKYVFVWCLLLYSEKKP